MGNSWMTALGGRIGGIAVLALACSACAASVDSDDAERSVASESSELKNASTLVDSNSRWRGVVSLKVWFPGFNAWSPCSGVITSRTTLVTAAHCVTYPLGAYTSGNVRVIVTRQTSTGAWQTLLGDSTVFAKYNPAYNGFQKNDVAVITAPTQWANITQSDAVPIGKDAPSGQTMWALGYGYYDVGAADNDGLGRAGSVVPTYSSGDYSFSATSSQPWLCNGDSGGPIKLGSRNWAVFGIASWFQGATGAKCGSVGHWAPTADNFEWLKYAIGYDKCIEFLNNLMYCW